MKVQFDIGRTRPLLIDAVGDDQQRPGAADIELHLHPVPGVQQARRVQFAFLAQALPLQAQMSRQVEQAPAGAEGRQGLRQQLKFPDVEGERQPLGRGPLGRQARPAQDVDVLAHQVVDLQPASQQLGVAPAHLHAVGFQPDAVFVRNGQPSDGEVPPDVAGQVLQLQTSEPAEPQAAGPRRDHQPALGRQGAVAHRQPGGGHDQHHGDQAEHAPARGGSRPPGPPARRGRNSGAQKLCPMLR